MKKKLTSFTNAKNVINVMKRKNSMHQNAVAMGISFVGDVSAKMDGKEDFANATHKMEDRRTRINAKSLPVMTYARIEERVTVEVAIATMVIQDNVAKSRSQSFVEVEKIAVN